MSLPAQILEEKLQPATRPGEAEWGVQMIQPAVELNSTWLY